MCHGEACRSVRCSDVCAARACPISASPLPDTAACSSSVSGEGCAGERGGGRLASDGVTVVAIEKCATPSSLGLGVCACLYSHSGVAVARVHRQAAHKTVGPASLLPLSRRSKRKVRRPVEAMGHRVTAQPQSTEPARSPLASACSLSLTALPPPSHLFHPSIPFCAFRLLACRPHRAPTLFS